MDEKIFISYSKKNYTYAHQIYGDLLWDGYLVWIDKRLEEGAKWRPQIDHNLKVSKRFIVFISPEAIDSKWVNHEISMACGRDLDIIPVKIKEYRPKELPIGVEEIQLFDLVEGAANYDRELKKLKNRLGSPVAIVQYMEHLLLLYETSNGEALLSEHQLRLYEKHKKKIVWPEGKESLGRVMVEKSYRALKNIWDKYDDLEKNYSRIQNEKDLLDRRMERVYNYYQYVRKRVIIYCIICFIVIVIFALAYLLK